MVARKWDLKGVIIPPIIAIAFYLFCLYVLIPLYRKRQLYAQYLPVALTPTEGPGLVTRTRGRVQDALADFFGNRLMWAHRRTSFTSADFNLGDEELEEGVAAEHLPHNAGDAGVERRLSRELEAGFRDDSDDDEEEERLGRSRWR